MARVSVGSITAWWGGKGSMAQRIMSVFPKHSKYVEVFGGGAHILYQKDKCREEVYNDIHEGLISLWRTVQNPEYSAELKRRLELTPMGRVEFDHCRDTWKEEEDPIEKARKFYVTVNQSFSAGLKNWKAMKGGNGVAKNTSKFYATINARYDYVFKRLQNILIESMDYKELLDKHDDEGVLFYIDPPYIGETRTLQKGYDHEMIDVTLHEELVDILLDLKGKALLSGYDHPVYDRLIENGWFKIHLGDFAKSSAYNEVGGTKTVGTEVLWVNYDIHTEKHVKDIVK